MDLLTLQGFVHNPGFTYEDAFDILVIFCRQKEIKVAVVESVKGGLVAGGGALIGGLLGGRQGMLLGGALGAALGANMAKEFRSIVDIIENDFTEEEMQELSEAFVKILISLAKKGIRISAHHLVNDLEAVEVIKTFITNHFASFHAMAVSA